MNPESAFFFSFGGDICTSANRKPRWGQSTRLAHICSFLSPQRSSLCPPVPPAGVLGWDRYRHHTLLCFPPSPPVPLPGLPLRLLQLAGIAFSKLFSFSSSSSHSALANSSSSSPGLKNKQGGTRSPPDLRGHRLLLDICFPPPLSVLSARSAALVFRHSQAIRSFAEVWCSRSWGRTPLPRPGQTLASLLLLKADAQHYVKHTSPPGLISRVKLSSQPGWDVAADQVKGSYHASHPLLGYGQLRAFLALKAKDFIPLFPSDCHP